jgi:hypothetical protein
LGIWSDAVAVVAWRNHRLSPVGLPQCR